MSYGDKMKRHRRITLATMMLKFARVPTTVFWLIKGKTELPTEIFDTWPEKAAREMLAVAATGNQSSMLISAQECFVKAFW